MIITEEAVSPKERRKEPEDNGISNYSFIA